MLGTDVAQVHLSAETLTKQREHRGDLTEGDHAILPAPTQQPNGCAAAGGEPYSDTPTRRSGLCGHRRPRAIATKIFWSAFFEARPRSARTTC
jgi:hypothetical protein